MNYVQLGRTGLHCAAVSFGGIPIQRSDAANTKDSHSGMSEFLHRLFSQ